MGVAIVQTFKDSDRKVRREVRQQLFFDYYPTSLRQTVIFAFLGLLMWAGDWNADSSHAQNMLIFRGACCVLLLVSALLKRAFQSMTANCLIAYAAFFLGETSYVLMAGKMAGDAGLGAGQFAYFFLGTLLICPHFSTRSNWVGCIGLAVLPLLLGRLLLPDFSYLSPYAGLLFPACALTMLCHYRIRWLLVENQRVQRELEKSTIFDPLSGLLNAKGFQWAFRRSTKLGEVKPFQQYLLLIDVDGYDEIKLTHGQGLIQALQSLVGGLIDTSFRFRDITANLGDGKFACLLQQVSREDAIEIAERFRQAVDGQTFECVTAETGQLSFKISIGIVRADPKDQIGTVLNRARIAVNQAKSLGGNQCACL